MDNEQRLRAALLAVLSVEDSLPMLHDMAKYIERHAADAPDEDTVTAGLGAIDVLIATHPDNAGPLVLPA